MSSRIKVARAVCDETRHDAHISDIFYLSRYKYSKKYANDTQMMREIIRNATKVH